jgi:pimeloyl-ACP methyl ester carboxylesterase
MRTLCYLIAALFSTGAVYAETKIDSRTAKIDNVELHYLTAGHGPAVILLHGYAETSRMWRPLIPLLAERFTVIAPDLPGIGDSSIPADKIDMITSASRIHSLVRSLGVEKARVVRGGNGEARGDGCVSSRCARMGSDLQRAERLAFSF